MTSVLSAAEPETMHLGDDTRLRPYPDAFFVRHGDGVWVRTAGGSFTVNGAGAYELIRHLMAAFDETRTIAEVCEAFPAAQRGGVRRLVARLVSNRVLKQDQGDVERPAWLDERYDDVLTYLDRIVDRPVAALLVARATRVACVGTGPVRDALARCLGDLAFDHVEFLPDAVAADLDPADVVLLVSESVDGACLADTVARLTAGGRACGVIGRVGDLLVVTPARAGAAGSCWECVARWLGRDAADATSEHPVAPAPAAIAALLMAQRVLHLAVGVDNPRDTTVLSVGTTVTSCQPHHVVRHPLCGRHPSPVLPPRAAGTDTRALISVGDAGLVRPDVATSYDAESLTREQDRIVEATAALTDSVTGPLTSVGEDELDQSRLAASACSVRGLTGTDEPVLVCHALAPREARNQAVLRGLELLATQAATSLEPGAATEIGRPVLAAGWSIGEAVYRALIRRTLVDGACDEAATEWPVARDGGPTRAYLLDVLTGLGIEPVSARVTASGTGLRRAVVDVGRSAPAIGAGSDDDVAIDHALLRAAAEALGDPATAAVLAPRGPAAWAALADLPATSACARADALLPFVAGRACVVAAWW